MGQHSMIRVLLAASLAVVVVGCSQTSTKITESEKKALQGGPMPAGTWDKIAESRRRYEASHGKPTGQATPPTPGG